MSKKQLISADDVRVAAKSGTTVIVLRDKTSIVTSEARSVAKELGISLELASTPSAPSTQTVGGTVQASEPGLDVVRRIIEAHTQGPASDAVMSEVLRRIEQEGAQPAGSQIRKLTSLCTSPRTSDQGVNMSQLDLASMGATTAAPCACGFMGWSKNQFPFTRVSDEVNLVLEGELQFHVGQDVITAVAGDVMWVPKGAHGKIGTATAVRYFYLSYPV